MENFFKRARFRRSKRLRSSVRSSLARKEVRTSNSAKDASSSEKGGHELKLDDPAIQSSCTSASATADHTYTDSRIRTMSTDAHPSQPLEITTSVPKTVNGAPSGPSSSKIISTSPVEKSDSWSTEPNDSTSSDLNLQSSQISLCQPSPCNASSAQPSSSHVSCQPSSSNTEPVASCSLSSEPSLSQPVSTADTKVVEQLRSEVDRLKKELCTSQEILAKMQEREKILRNRLSEQAQRQLQKGSSKFEDLSLGESRPTQLIKRYGNLYTESRLDAMDALDDVPNMADCEDLKVKLLLSVVVLAFRSAEKTLNEMKSKIRELLHIPRVIESGNMAFCHAAKELEEAVAFYLRKTIEKHDISKTYKDVCDRVWITLYDYPMLKECTGLLRYIDDSVRIAWAMSVQNPPFVIDYESKVFNADLHVRFHTSDAESPEIKSVLWPILLEGAGGPCVAKGVVLT